MKIFAVIVTYNAMRRQWIDHCLESLRQSTISITPVVVDNLSTDGTRTHVPSHYPDAVWMPQTVNLGFGQANNLGIAYALNHHADYVLLLNQDATISPNAVKDMIAADDHKSIISPLHLNGSGTMLDRSFRFSISQMPDEFFDDIIVRHKAASSYTAHEICAACWFIPAHILRAIGGFNPLFFHYGEDNNYYQRLTFHNYHVTLVPSAHMCHDRQEHGNITVYNHRHLHRDLLLIFGNINHGFAKCMRRYLSLIFRQYTKQLPARQYIPGTILIETLRLLPQANSIRLSRKKEKLTAPTWLPATTLQ